VWERFGLQRQKDFSNARQCQFFGSIARHLAGRQVHIHEEVLLRLGPAINRYDFTGLLANLIAASVLRKAGELSAHYFIQTGIIALDGAFSADFGRDLSMLIIKGCHSFRLDLSRFLEVLLKDDNEGEPSYLDQFLSETPEDKWSETFLALLNASALSTTPHLRARVLAELTSKTAQMKSEECRDDVLILLDLTRVSDGIAAGGTMDSEDMHKRWEGRKGHWLYPAYLKMLLRSGANVERTVDDVFRILDRDPLLDDSNTYLRLAVSICQWLVDEDRSNEAAIPVGYLKTAIERWKPTHTAEDNCEVYRLLYSLDTESSQQYLGELMKWEDIKIQRDHLKRIPELMKEGAYFHVFEYYFRTMRFWGLETDIPRKSLLSQIHASECEKDKMFLEWHAGSRVVPEPLVKRGDEVVLSSQFLILGHILFSAPRDLNPAFDQGRAGFDLAARRSLPNLLELISSLPSLPTSIKQLLEKYSNRFYEYSQPVE
jgi:hypothetical protein